MGNDSIFFRSNKFQLVEKFLDDVRLEEGRMKGLETSISIRDPLIITTKTQAQVTTII